MTRGGTRNGRLNSCKMRGLQHMAGGDTLFVVAARIKCHMDRAIQLSADKDDIQATISVGKAMNYLRRGLAGDQRPDPPPHDYQRPIQWRAERMLLLLVQTFEVKQFFVERIMVEAEVEIDPLRWRLLAKTAAGGRKDMETTTAACLKTPRM